MAGSGGDSKPKVDEHIVFSLYYMWGGGFDWRVKERQRGFNGQILAHHAPVAARLITERETTEYQ